MPETAVVEAIHPSTIDWARVRRCKYRVHQRFNYSYPDRIHDLRHQLMVIPPATFGDQHREVYSLRLSEPGEVITRIDTFNNTVLDVRIPSVESTIEFEAWTMLERTGPPVPRALADAGPRLLEATGRTASSSGIEQAADELRLSGAEGLTLAKLANDWVHRSMTYTRGITGVHTTAAEALAAGGGVCQDYSHVMIAICRLLGIPALYVSGHQLGEGGTHSWVEVLLPAADGSGRGWALDPTHGCSADLTYLTVAVGRDYDDVAPTSGSYRAGHGGSLTGYKEVLVTDVDYSD